MAVTTGTRPNWIFSKTRCHICECCMTPKASRCSCSERSRPAQKCSPLPASTTALASAGGASKKRSRLAIRASLTALRFAGRSRRTIASAPRCSIARCGSAGSREPAVAEELVLDPEGLHLPLDDAALDLEDVAVSGAEVEARAGVEERDTDH